MPENHQNPIALVESNHSIHSSLASVHNGHDIEKYPSHHHSDSHSGVSRIITSGVNDEIIHIGKEKYYKNELIKAFGGSLNPGLSAPSIHKFGNPGPLGLSAFALTTFLLSMINAKAMGVTETGIVIGAAMFYGGFIQLCTGMWELALENTFGALALSSYGGFWMSFGAINIPWFGIASSYTNERDLEVATGFFLLGWTIFTFMLVLTTMKSTLGFFSLYFFLDLTFLLLSIGQLAPSTNCTRAGGIFGIITAFISWYNAYAGLANPENAYVTVRAIQLPVYKGKKRN
ncbi:hypothetical protein PACTADRAFT_48270 [Pachysolen tannophilus NRRL Y-2460]|uniref:Ammonia transport outward protein 2 n=1 Tax=Pachysolen tannophilus NRRL Y-2460 TaxID=669874 RepID=A0A1E4U3G1_PACTA|nr:hypothetical protein PACTADRAFT_48270 [Pachysolen tannophilus NRRL Y-2460]